MTPRLRILRVLLVNKSGCSFAHNYMLKCESDSLSIFKSIALNGNNEVYVFDGKGRRYCYSSNDSISCSGSMLELVFHQFQENFEPCINNSISLEQLQQRFIPIVATDELILHDSSYYLVYYWSKFFGGKRQYKENLMWLKSMQMESPLNFTILMVNTDLQEAWGLEPGKKMKIKLKINSHGGSVTFGKIPYRKNRLDIL